MQYLVSVIDDTPNSATPDEMTGINAFNDGLQADGHWVFAGGRRRAVAGRWCPAQPGWLADHDRPPQGSRPDPA